jgi:hypothetical protein
MVPAGSSRTVVIRAYDAAGIETHRGQATINVVEGTNPTVSITLLPLTGNQPIVATIGTFVVTVSPSVDTLTTGDTVRLHATVMTATGDTVVSVQWATLNPGRATVDTAGLVTAGSPGAVQIVATFAGVGGSAAIQVIGTNYGLQFDGRDIVVIPDTPSLNHLTGLTAECWVLFDSVDAGQYTILKDNGGHRQWGIGLNGTTSPGPLRKLRAIIATTSGLHTVDGATTIPFNTWLHVAETYDGSTLLIYVNGVVDGSTTINETMIPSPVPLPVTMGNNPEAFPLHGQLDEVRVWDVALNQSQIQAGMSGELTGAEAGLVGYWTLDEGTGLVVHDRTANGNNGTLGSNVGPDSLPPTWVIVSHP